MNVLRTMLFTPGNNWRMIQKASSLQADAIILDLEDAVPMLDKETARILARDGISIIKAGGPNVFIRINAIVTSLTAQDMKDTATEGLDGIVLPKAESKEEILEAERLVEEVEKEKNLKSGGIAIIPIIETAKGVVNAYEIARASKRVNAISFGAVDFTRDMGTTISKEGTELFYARSQIAVAARAAGIQAIDTPWIDLADKEGLVNDSRLARQLGYKGKLLIHPDQIESVNKVFSPSKEEVEYAKKVVEAFKEAEAKGLGAISLEGKMVDVANYRQAKDLLSLVDAISAKERTSCK